MASLTSAFLQGVDLQCPAMDDDSQDELINKNAALGKGRRQSLAFLSETGKCSLYACTFLVLGLRTPFLNLQKEVKVYL